MSDPPTMKKTKLHRRAAIFFASAPCLNEHELLQARQANEAIRQALVNLGQLRSSYLEAEHRAYGELLAVRSKLTSVVSGALSSRGLEAEGDWKVDFATGELTQAGRPSAVKSEPKE